MFIFSYAPFWSLAPDVDLKLMTLNLFEHYLDFMKMFDHTKNETKNEVSSLSIQTLQPITDTQTRKHAGVTKKTLILLLT